MKNQPREILIRSSLMVMGVVLSLVLAESLVRVAAPAPGRIQFVPDAEVGFRHVPNQSVWVTDETREFAAWFKTNQFGDPDLERTMEKPVGVYRIAVVGDSMVEAAQVPLEERFTYLLEKRLTDWAQTQDIPTRKVEVLNFGASGYSTAQELLYYRAHIRQFAPDLVLLVFLPGNDIKNNSYELEVVQSCRPEIAPFLTLSESQELVILNEDFYALALQRSQNADQPAGEKLKATLRKKVRLFDLAYRGYGALRSGTLVTGRVLELDQDACQTETTLQLFDPEIQQTSQAWQDAWHLTGAIIQQFAREVAADGARFHMISVTGPWEVQEETRDLVLGKAEQARYDWEMPDQMSAELTASLGVPHFQLLPAMKKAVLEDGIAVHYTYNGHYTPAGHRIAAEALFPVLQDYLEE